MVGHGQETVDSERVRQAGDRPRGVPPISSSPAPSEGRRASRSWSRRVPYAPITVLVALAIWQAVVGIASIPEYLLPAPSSVIQTIVDNGSLYWSNAQTTVVEVLLGFAVSAVLGLGIGVLLAYSRRLERAVFPLVVLTQTVPMIAVAPLVLVWFGYGLPPKVGIAAVIAIFPVIVNSVVGFKGAPEEMIFLMRSMGGGRLTLVRRILFPNALPSIFSGLKLASALSVIGAVVAEFVGANSGLGYLIVTGAGNIKTKQEFACVLLLSLLGIAFFSVISIAERFVIPWHSSVRPRH